MKMLQKLTWKRQYIQNELKKKRENIQMFPQNLHLVNILSRTVKTTKFKSLSQSNTLTSSILGISRAGSRNPLEKSLEQILYRRQYRLQQPKINCKHRRQRNRLLSPKNFVESKEKVRRKSKKSQKFKTKSRNKRSSSTALQTVKKDH